jgi:hypothetical protein
MKLKTSDCVDVSTYSANFDDSTCLFNVLTCGSPVCCSSEEFCTCCTIYITTETQIHIPDKISKAVVFKYTYIKMAVKPVLFVATGTRVFNFAIFLFVSRAC